MREKSLLQLTPGDFRQFQLWIETDNIYDEDEVAPLTGSIALEKYDMIYYVAAEFALADGSTYDGYMRLAYGKPTVICLAINETDFAMYVLSQNHRETLKETPGDFARLLGRPVEAVFPIEYQTGYHFVDNTPVQGTVEIN